MTARERMNDAKLRHGIACAAYGVAKDADDRYAMAIAWADANEAYEDWESAFASLGKERAR